MIYCYLTCTRIPIWFYFACSSWHISSIPKFHTWACLDVGMSCWQDRKARLANWFQSTQGMQMLFAIAEHSQVSAVSTSRHLKVVSKQHELRKFLKNILAKIYICFLDYSLLFIIIQAVIFLHCSFLGYNSPIYM